MPRQITPSTTLDNLKKEAKRWHKALRDNDAEARARLARAWADAPATPVLRDVQRALALEYGYPGWSALKERLSGMSSSRPTHVELIGWFFDNACPDHHVRGGPQHVAARHTALRILEQHPEVARDNFYTAIVRGDLAEVQRVLSDRPEMARRKSGVPSDARSGAGGSDDWLREIGPKGWEPLLYLCFTRLPLQRVTDNAVAIARLLLDHGADPNVYFMAGDSRYTPLVGAIGEGEEDRPAHPQRDALVRLLLDRGAEPYDIQVLYNIHFHGDALWYLELAYERSLALGRQADWQDPAWEMLGMGGYGPGSYYILNIAVKHNNLRLAAWALSHGASPNVMTYSHPQFRPQRSLREDAIRRGHTELAALFERFGAAATPVTMTDLERCVIACMRLDRDAVRSMLSQHPEFLQAPDALFEAASRDRPDVIECLLDLGMSPDVRNRINERPLHMAAYQDSIRAAELLIARGAEIDPVESGWNNSPLGAAVYGQHTRMIELLGRYSRDMFQLVYSGNVERVRKLITEQPELARVAGGGHTLLMWLPTEDEDRALEIATLLLANGADPTLANKDGLTAADRADKRGMPRVSALLRAHVR